MAVDVESSGLPPSGLAEEILSRFVQRAQEEVEATTFSGELRRDERNLHLVTFHLGQEEYGVEISRVQEIIRAGDITPVPGAPDQIRGVINLRGKIIPVVDLRRRFSLPVLATVDAQRIIVVELGERRLGMLVDSVSQVIRFASSVVEEIPEEAISVGGNFTSGVAKLENRLVMILDLGRTLLTQ